jgi:D-serine dehydratase
LRTLPLPKDLLNALAAEQPLLWLSSRRGEEPDEPGGFDLHDAARHFASFAPLLARLFPEFEASGGLVDSPLVEVPRLRRLSRSPAVKGRWFVKADHELAVAGSIKARGGFFEVLLHAEDLARKHGLIPSPDGMASLSGPKARRLFERHSVSVGSTGNLGMSIGLIAKALGFRAEVHMSADAKPWKVALLEAEGVQVVRHIGDYGAAVKAGREKSLSDPFGYFVDDENSLALFTGYAVAALELQRQLNGAGIAVGRERPLFIYIPCGVGGAPGGIAHGLSSLFGAHVHCFFAEPVAAPCMLLRLASGVSPPLPLSELGLSGETEADGLAVGRASELAARLIETIVAGVFTVSDDELFRNLQLLHAAEGMKVEPSAAAALRGPEWLFGSSTGARYLEREGLAGRAGEAIHVLWTTGGSRLPPEDHAAFLERGREAHREVKVVA